MPIARSFLAAALLASLASVIASGEERPKLLADVFTDHVVLQRDRPVRVFGTAAPGETVTAALDERTVQGAADASGAWSVMLPALPAGGPHTLTASSAGTVQAIEDVMIGDVWLCAGQSNMELPVSRSLNAPNEIAGSADDAMRLLKVPQARSPVPRSAFGAPVAWRLAAPETVAGFSAACYYFARELRKTVPVPTGLIDASWGGSIIETWISADGLAAVGGFDERLELLREHGRDPAAATARLGAMWEDWWRAAVPGSEPWRPESTRGWRDAPRELGDWKQWGPPELAGFLGMVWHRRVVELTDAQTAGPARLALGVIDEVDQTWVNGRPVGNTFGWNTAREYEVPAGLLREGRNVIVVNALNTWGMGGMVGPVEQMVLKLWDGSVVPLAGGWQYLKAPSHIGQPPRAPWESIGGLTTLYNAMVAPLGPIALGGALWYQGESNAPAADEYEALLLGLMADWRSRFGSDLPFLVVQLPNFGDPVTTPVESDWADLREAQRRAVARDSRAALAVTIDVGDRHELHPPNKQAVGARLARAARHVVYGETVTPSGPRPAAVERRAGGLVVRLEDVEGALVAYSAAQPIGFEVCGDSAGTCRFAPAAIDGSRVLLSPPDEDAITRVRYCWGDAPICNLYDRSGLPAGPFELRIDE